MQRDPSIHIKESELRKILNEGLGKGVSINVEGILKKARKKSCNNRSVSITNDKLDKKVTKILKSRADDVHVFNNILFMVRKRAKHFGFRKVEENSRDWGLLKEITSLALDFTNEFHLDRKKGFTAYCDIALSKMNKFSYPKLKSMFESICQIYFNKQEIENDDTPHLTKSIHDFYVKMIVQRTGNPIDYYSQPESYYHFITVKNLVKEKKIKYEDYIRAQFAGLDYMNGVPHPAQLVGDKANERLSRYLYESGKKVNQVEKSERANALKNLRRGKDKTRD